MHNIDSDLEALSKLQLIEECILLRNAIRKHRDCSGHELCWYHPELWSLLPEYEDNKIEVPEPLEFLRRCIEYRESLG